MPVMLWELLLLLILLSCSAAASAAETALFGLNRRQLQAFRDSGHPLKVQAYRLMLHPRSVLLTILIGNTAANVLYFAISTFLVRDAALIHPMLGTATAILLVLVTIIASELLPKAFALAWSEGVAAFFAPTIATLRWVLTPLRWTFDRLVIEPLVRLLSSRQHDDGYVTVDELQDLMERLTRGGTIDSVESRMLQEIVALGDLRVRSVMIPRVDIVAVSSGQSSQEVLQTINEAHFTKVPVYDIDLDDIRGLIYARDIYLNPGQPWTSLLRPVLFVPEQANLVQLLGHFRRGRCQLVVVVDEYGGTAGLVTLEDVLERIVGDIKGRGEKHEAPPVEQIDQNTYRLSGDVSARTWAEQLGLDPRELRVDTVGGLVTHKLGRVPRLDDEVVFQNLTLTVERMDGRRIETLILRRHRSEQSMVHPREEETQV